MIKRIIAIFAMLLMGTSVCSPFTPATTPELGPIAPPAVRTEGLKTFVAVSCADANAATPAPGLPCASVVTSEVTDIITDTPKETPSQSVSEPLTSSYDDEIWVLAQAMAGECYPEQYEDMVKVGMTLCNRVDDPRFPNTLYGVITQPYQVHGYSPYNQPTGLYLEAATYVVNTWYANKDGAGLPWDYTIFFWAAGGGRTNTFRSQY